MGSGWAVNWGGVNHSSAITVPMGTGHVNLRFEILDDEGSPNSFTSATLENTLENATKIIEQDERKLKIRLTYTMLIGRYRKS